MDLSFIFWFPVLLGSLFIVVGKIFSKYPPKKINWIYGYRTSSSMKSQERWDYAQEISSTAMQWVGIAMYLVGLWVYFMGFNENKAMIIDTAWMLFSFLLLFLYVERKIASEFNDNEIH
jgi:uncharacterized membrane protein